LPSLAVEARSPRHASRDPAHCRRFGCTRLDEYTNPITANALKPVACSALTLHAMPSAHETLEQDEHGDYRFISFIVQAGTFTIYHSGDCAPYDGLVDRFRNWKIDLALLIPCHYEMFEFNTVAPEGFVEVAEQIDQKYRVLKCGERLSL
jgi:L-ascorbate metabolism protein UlaG (beta-lactamase superfamily)